MDKIKKQNKSFLFPFFCVNDPVYMLLYDFILIKHFMCQLHRVTTRKYVFFSKQHVNLFKVDSNLVWNLKLNCLTVLRILFFEKIKSKNSVGTTCTHATVGHLVSCLVFGFLWSLLLSLLTWIILILDCGAKAEDAIDYEDIDEEYDGPETETANEEDYLLPKMEFFSAEASLEALESRASVFDDENYDEESEKEQDLVNDDAKVDNISLAGNIFLLDLHNCVIAVVLCELLT